MRLIATILAFACLVTAYFSDRSLKYVAISLVLVAYVAATKGEK